MGGGGLREPVAHGDSTVQCTLYMYVRQIALRITVRFFEKKSQVEILK